MPLGTKGATPHAHDHPPARLYIEVSDYFDGIWIARGKWQHAPVIWIREGLTVAGALHHAGPDLISMEERAYIRQAMGWPQRPAPLPLDLDAPITAETFAPLALPAPLAKLMPPAEFDQLPKQRDRGY